MELKMKIASIMSEILSDKHDCKVTLRFVPENMEEEHEKKNLKKSA